MSSNWFEGWYFKHQKYEDTVAFIPGSANNGAFIQVATNERSYHFDFPNIEVGNKISVGSCDFDTKGVKIDLPGIRGKINYGPITPLRSDIMGPFRFFPMECRHGIISMGHTLTGSLWLEDREINFDDGIGYIEKDSGCSFPKEYTWLQYNDVESSCNIMVSVANIPFSGFHFTGCICAIVHNGREYRLATYKGVKIIRADSKRIHLSQGPYMLVVDIQSKDDGHPLKSPVSGNMTGVVRESNCAMAHFLFMKNEHVIFDFESRNASFEHVS